MDDGKSRKSIPSANSETFLFPTSFAQQRLWFFEQLYPGSTVYHLSTVLPFEGLLDRKALEESLGDLLDRHEGLRTTFTALDGAPVQLVAPAFIDMPPVSLWDEEELWMEVMPAVTRALRQGGVFIPCFSTRPVLRWQFVHHFDRIMVERRSYSSYATTDYVTRNSGEAYIQCFIRVR